jgi:large subunit ribosomal protein L1
MAQHGKRYKSAREQVDSQKRYNLEEAVDMLQKMTNVKFDETIDLAIRLGVNPRHADQMVRGSCVLPAGTGKPVRVLVFAKGDKEKEASEAGADFVGNEDLIQKISDGWLEFDKCIATPDMMKDVAKLGRILGTRGMMPSPKLGTVTFDVAQAVDAFKKGKVEFKVDKVGILHIPIGKKSFENEKLMENILAVMGTVIKLKPSTAKGTYLRNVSVSSTMGPGIKLDPVDIQNRLR